MYLNSGFKYSVVDTSKLYPGGVGNGGKIVNKIIAGSNIIISPTSGIGDVTINSVGGDSGGEYDVIISDEETLNKTLYEGNVYCIGSLAYIDPNVNIVINGNLYTYGDLNDTPTPINLTVYGDIHCNGNINGTATTITTYGDIHCTGDINTTTSVIDVSGNLTCQNMTGTDVLITCDGTLLIDGTFTCDTANMSIYDDFICSGQITISETFNVTVANNMTVQGNIIADTGIFNITNTLNCSGNITFREGNWKQMMPR